MFNVEADTALYGGQLARARSLTQRAVESAQRMDEKEAAALYLSDAGVREALFGNGNLAKQRERSALAISNGTDVEGLSAVALAMAVDSSGATQLVDDLARRFPENTFVQFSYLPTIRGAVFLRQGNVAKAAAALAIATPHELASNETLNFVLYPVYLRGEAYLKLKQGNAAAAEFQNILDHPGIVRSEPIGALAQLQLGQAYALAGDSDKARSSYQNFLTLWKDADTDIPLLKQAKAEFARLH
jgi:tetratricopeptide (TPR) repeat protein